ncbi:MAG: IMPACT family protein [Prevotella sp.]
MEDTYLTVTTPSEGLYTSRRSRFLSFAHHVESEAEVRELLTAYRRRYYDARHVCYAYIIGVEGVGDGVRWRMNDDGEPSSTAGKPIHGQIVRHGLTDTLVVVVRYYGGVNLGTSGLIVAYREAAAAALAESAIEERVVEERVVHTFAYPAMNSVMRVVKEMGARVVAQDYGCTCTITLAIRRSQAPQLRERLQRIAFGEGGAV